MGMTEIDYEKEVLDMALDRNHIRLSLLLVSRFGYPVAAYLQALINWRKEQMEWGRIKEDESFSMTQEMIRERTCLSIKQQELAIKKLKNMEILSIERIASFDGGRCNYYRINQEMIAVNILKGGRE